LDENDMLSFSVLVVIGGVASLGSIVEFGEGYALRCGINASGVAGNPLKISIKVTVVHGHYTSIHAGSIGTTCEQVRFINRCITWVVHHLGVVLRQEFNIISVDLNRVRESDDVLIKSVLG